MAEKLYAAAPRYSMESGHAVTFLDLWTDACFESRFHKTDWDKLRGPRADRYCQATGYMGMHPDFFYRHAKTEGFDPPERGEGESKKSHALRITAYMRADLDRYIQVHARGMVAFLKACKGDYPCAVSYYRHGYTGAPDSEETARSYASLRRKMSQWFREGGM